MKYRMSEGMTNIGTPLKEAMERTPRPNTPLGLPLFWDAPAPRPDGSLINEGTKEPETSYATAWLSGHAQGLEDGMAMKREQKLLTDSDFADILEDEIEKQGGGGAGFNVDQLMRAVEKVCRERYTTPPQRTWVGLTDEMVLAGARALAKRHADSCGLDFDDVWKYYADEHKDDAKAVIEAAHGIKGEA